MAEIKKESYPEMEGDYPYGTRIDLEGDIVEELGLDNIEAGQDLIIKGVVTVSRKVEEYEGDEGEEGVEKKVCLQLKTIDIVGKAKVDRASILYSDSEDKE